MATKDNLQLLMKHCPELFKDGKVLIFQHFLCPISIVDADVKEYVIDEYDSVELLILRLYDAGITTPSAISELTGIDRNMVNKLLLSEKFTYGHINPETDEVTEAGKATLLENTDMEHLFQHALYDVKRELQVDSLTGTLIKAEAEMLKSKMAYFSDRFSPNVLPQESVYIDKELDREIHERLQLYINDGYLKEGNTINSIGEMHTKEVKYRDAYFTYIEGFNKPFIVISYEKRDKGVSEKVLEPIAISESDFARIPKEKDECSYLVRADEYFDYLDKYRDEFESCPEIDEDLLKKLLSVDNDEVEIVMDISDELELELIENSNESDAENAGNSSKKTENVDYEFEEDEDDYDEYEEEDDNPLY